MNFMEIAAALVAASGLGDRSRPRRDLRKGVGKAKRKERKAERQNRKKGRK